MTGLILKDIFTILKQAKVFLFIAAAMLLIQNDFMLTYVICYASMLPFTALGYDERAKWNKFADMLPYTTTELVGSKYLLGYLSVGIAVLITIASKCFYVSVGKASFSREYWIVLLLTVCAALILLAVNLPFMFWIGVERGRLLFILLIIAAIVFTTTALDNLTLGRMQIESSLLLAAALTITVTFNLISFWLSKIAYKH